MAEKKLKLSLVLVKNNNAESTSYGKYFPQVCMREPLSFDALVDHVTEHAMCYPRDIVAGVIQRISICLPELLSQGVSVKLDGIGTFQPWAETAKGKAVARPELGLNPKELIKGVHIRCIPEGRKAQNITSRVFKEKCKLSLDYVLASGADGGLVEIPAYVDSHA